MPQKSTLSFNKIHCYQPPRRELLLFFHTYDLQVPFVGTPSRELFSYSNQQPNLTCELTSHGVAQRAVPCRGCFISTYGPPYSHTHTWSADRWSLSIPAVIRRGRGVLPRNLGARLRRPPPQLVLQPDTDCLIWGAKLTCGIKLQNHKVVIKSGMF